MARSRLFCHILFFSSRFDQTELLRLLCLIVWALLERILFRYFVTLYITLICSFSNNATKNKRKPMTQKFAFLCTFSVCLIRLRCSFRWNCFWNSLHNLIVARLNNVPGFNFLQFARFFFFARSVGVVLRWMHAEKLATDQNVGKALSTIATMLGERKCIKGVETQNKHLVRDGFCVHTKFRLPFLCMASKQPLKLI